MPNPVNSKSVVIKTDTYKKLISRKQQGQSIDDVIRELLELPQKKRKLTLERIAQQPRKSIGTIRNSVKYAVAVETLAQNCGQWIKNEILEGSIKFSKRDIIKLSNLKPDVQRIIIDEYLKDGLDSFNKEFDSEQ